MYASAQGWATKNELRGGATEEQDATHVAQTDVWRGERLEVQLWMGRAGARKAGAARSNVSLVRCPGW